MVFLVKKVKCISMVIYLESVVYLVASSALTEWSRARTGAQVGEFRHVFKRLGRSLGRTSLHLETLCRYFLTISENNNNNNNNNNDNNNKMLRSGLNCSGWVPHWEMLDSKLKLLTVCTNNSNSPKWFNVTHMLCFFTESKSHGRLGHHKSSLEEKPLKKGEYVMRS